jgi:predicted nucleotidyltransferase
MDKREHIISKVRDYCSLVKNSKFSFEKAYLFGSFAQGNAKEDSDIDVAFIVKHLEGDYYDIISEIWRLRKQIDFRIEPHLIARDTDYSDFIKEIERTGIEI